MTVNFHVTNEDAALIEAIVKRATPLPSNWLALSMDITAVHLNGCPLDLQRWLSAGGFDFSHDIVGIQAHLNRKTGKLKDFVPRYAKRSTP